MAKIKKVKEEQEVKPRNPHKTRREIKVELPSRHAVMSGNIKKKK